MTSETGQVVGSIRGDADDAIAMNSMKMATVDGERLAIIRTAEGVFAIDNSCPHQGYGLVTGELGRDADDAPVVTCLWHNWKFRVNDGVCVIGEENVPCHEVEIDQAGTVRVTVQRRSAEEQQAVLWPSLQSALEREYVGQLSRDTVRLLDVGATPEQIMAAAVAGTVERTEDGADHEIALAADCLGIALERKGDDRMLPLVIGLSGLSEQTRGRAPMTATPSDRGDLVELIEAEDLSAAMGRAAIMDPGTARPAMIEAASRHHLGYGHGAIYVQKSFEMLNRVGWETAPVLLPQLARSLTLMTREDSLPYMRKTSRAIAASDLDGMATTARTEGPIPDEVIEEFLAADEPRIEAAVELALGGLGVEGLIELASLGSARRMLRYDTGNEPDVASNFSWLAITHGLTHARAARWAWEHDPGPHVARMALHAIWLLFDTGRLERKAGVLPVESIDVGADLQWFADQLLDEAMNDQGGSFIVVAHLIKTIRAALEETMATGSDLPLQAAARFIRGHRRERFVARNVAESVRFVRTGRPPQR